MPSSDNQIFDKSSDKTCSALQPGTSDDELMTFAPNRGFAKFIVHGGIGEYWRGIIVCIGVVLKVY